MSVPFKFCFFSNIFTEIFLAVPQSSELRRDKQAIIPYLSPDPSQTWKNGAGGGGGAPAMRTHDRAEDRSRQAYCSRARRERTFRALVMCTSQQYVFIQLRFASLHMISIRDSQPSSHIRITWGAFKTTAVWSPSPWKFSFNCSGMGPGYK